MHIIDLSIFVLYILFMLGFGVYFLRTNKGAEDYYVGGRKMGSLHIGLSVVATDVGGGFSIGLGGLGFVMGLSGSYMLMTGLVGAWLAAVFLIPKVKNNKHFASFMTLPDIFRYFYGPWVAIVAGLISAIGYAGFTSSQILAGAKLANGTFAYINLQQALIIMGIVAVVYTVMGGLKAVIYTDTVQWIILMFGLIFIGIPISFFAVGGVNDFHISHLFSWEWLSTNASNSWSVIYSTLDPKFLSLSNITWQKMVNWAITIIPIWFVGMTLYQRIYACRDTKTAKRAWYYAGLFEYPVMAFMGVSLGVLARVAADQGMFDYLGAENISQADPETGLPMLLRTVLPVGMMGLMMSAYFSAILSTADSCLMASSGNVVGDIIGRFRKMHPDSKEYLRFSQITTLALGTGALLLAASVTQVLDLMLQSYAFMVSGLLVPIIGAFYWKKSSWIGAMAAMLLGGFTTLLLQSNILSVSKEMTKSELLTLGAKLKHYLPTLPVDMTSMNKEALFTTLNELTSKAQIVDIGLLNLTFQLPFNLDPNIYGIFGAAVVFIILSLIFPRKGYTYTEHGD